MKRVLFLLLFILSDILAFSQSPPEGKVEDILSDLEYYSSLYPRLEGSSSEKDAFQYILNVAETSERTVLSLRDFRDAEGMHSFSRIMEVTVYGSSKDTLLIAVPMSHDGDLPPNRDGSINLALATGLLRRYGNVEPPITLKFLFLGADSLGGANRGSDYFIRNYFPDYPVSVLYLGLQAIPTRVLFECGGQGKIAPYWLLERYSASMQSTEIPFLTLGNENQVSRIGITGGSSPLGRYLESEYPGVALEGVYDQSPALPDDQWIQRFVLFFNNFLQENKQGFQKEWDKHYLFFQVRSSYVIISEKLYILSIVLILSFGIVYALIFSRQVLRYLRTMWRNFWNVPVLLFLIFLFLFAATIYLDAFLLVRDFPSLWRERPIFFFTLKIAAAILLFSLMFQLLRNLPLSKNGSFYSASTLVLLLADIFLMAAINISYSYYFLWAFIFAFLFSLLRNRLLKLLCLLISPYWLIKAAVDIFTLPEFDIARILLFSRIYGNLLLAFITLPFLLMVIRLDFLVRHPIKGRRGFAIVLVSSVLGVLTLGLSAYLFTFKPYSEKNPQPLSITETFDKDTSMHRIAFESPASLETFSFQLEDILVPVDTRERNYSSDLPACPETFPAEYTVSQFLDRKHYRIRLSSKGLPVRSLTLKLLSPEDIILYDSNFPFSLNPMENTADIYIGENPPVPLDIEFTAPDRLFITADIQVASDALPGEWNIQDRTFRTETLFLFSNRLPLE